ncbi:MAG: efflux RND transporter periplasmic adaptor subunit [Shimia sp.]
MRILPLFSAALVAAFLYLLVFERDVLTGRGEMAAAQIDGPAEDVAAPAQGEAEADTETLEADGRVSVVALRSVARDVDDAVQVRGETEAARQVDVRAETSGQVVSEPLRKGAFVEAGQLMCELEPGTREATLAEAEARLAEARARLPETRARISEAEARLEEALINDNAAARLSEGGFASETRVAGTRATVQAARAAVEAAQSGLSSSQAGIQSAEAGVAAARKEIERLRMEAPFAGLLESDTAELGSLLQPGSLCATVIQLDPIKLVGFVPEADVDAVELGAQAGARLVTGREAVGRVTFLSRSADATTRTFRVEVEVPNPDLAIRDGQTVEMLIAAEGTQAHMIPGSALTLDDAGTLGVRVVEDATARFVPVDLLRDTAQGVLIAGLPEAADVIVVGQEYVSDGVPVAVTYRDALDADEMGGLGQ